MHLMVFMTKHLMDSNGQANPMSDNEATYWYHMFTSAVYYTPIFGAILSDAFLENIEQFLLLSIIYCLVTLL